MGNKCVAAREPNDNVVSSNNNCRVQTNRRNTTDYLGKYNNWVDN